ncbi:MAG: hypothetical protein KF809_01745 [Chloroflexi bacterium]|nr:hypothetical protein [Chloroflexota bacterium]
MWVERVARPRIDADARVIEATEQYEAAANAVRKTLEPDDLPRLGIYARIFGTEAVVNDRRSSADDCTAGDRQPIHHL